jgi:ComF family protein
MFIGAKVRISNVYAKNMMLMLVFWECKKNVIIALMNAIRSLSKALLHLVYPRVCAQCGWDLYEDEETLCLKCCLTLPKAAPTLYHPHLLQLFFGSCQWEMGILYLKMEKSGGVRQLIHDLKYHDRPEIGYYLGLKWGQFLLQYHPYLPWNAIVPVPMHPKKMRRRGYNQCDSIAAGFSNATGIPIFNGALIKSHHSESQTKKKRMARMNTNPFRVVNPTLLEGQHILLLDDVVTTGATLSCCYQALSEVNGLRCSAGALAYPIHNRLG